MSKNTSAGKELLPIVSKKQVKLANKGMNNKTLQPDCVNQIIVNAWCAKQPVNLLVDTGAGISLVNTRFIRQSNLMDKIQPTSTLIAGIGKNLIPLRGEIDLLVTIGEQVTSHCYGVCDSLDNEFLIGLDLLNKVQARINLPEKKLCLPSGVVEFIDKPISLKGRHKIRCNKNVTLKANSTGYIWGKIAICNAKNNYEGVVEPYRQLSNRDGVFVTGTISYSRKNLIPIHYVNVMENDVTLYKNQLVAFLEPLCNSQGVQRVNKVSQHYVTHDYHVDIPRLPDAISVEETIERGRWEDINVLYEKLGIDKMKISQSYKNDLKSLISEFSHCFARNRFDLGEASFYKAKIKLKHDYEAKWIPSRPVSYKLEDQMDEEIESMLKADHITPCPFSLWNSQTFLVEKGNPGRQSGHGGPDGQSGRKFRFVQDARALNSQTIQDCYELPRINTIMDHMSECKWLSNLDFQSSFTQIGLSREDQDLTSFYYKGKQYMWKRMVMGMTNSSAQYSRALNLLLMTKIPFSRIILYIDDCLLWSPDEKSHLMQLKYVLERLSWGNMKLNPDKSKMFQTEVLWLGYKVSSHGVKLDQEKIKPIQSLPAPTSVKQVQKFLGSMNYYRRFLRQFATMAAPLYDLLKKGKKFNWTKECQESFDKLKAALTSSPVLGVPDVSDKNRSYQVTIDSSKRGQGAVLTQEISGTRRVIAYWSRAVPKHQQKFGATRLELIALHGALKHWRIYLQGTRFVVYTDCKALLSLSKIFRNENSYIQRRLADLASFNFLIQHQAGQSSEMGMADFLSRHGYETATKESATQTENESHSQVNEILRITQADGSKPVSSEDIKEEYSNDRILSTVISWIKDDDGKPNEREFNPRSQPSELQHYWKDFELLKMEDGVLYRKWYDTVSRDMRSLIVVPCTLVERVLYSFHDTVDTCHAGVQPCIERCMKHFYFYKLKREFELYIGSCVTCGRAKQPTTFSRAPLKPIVYTEFNQCISIDHLEPSKTPTARGTVALLTICDHFTNYLVCVPVRSTGTEASIRAVLEHWVLKNGMPGAVMHDLGSGFTSGLWKAVMKAFDIKDLKTTPKFSQSNGKAEAMNRKLNQSFRVTLTDTDWKNYDVYVKYIVFTLNSLACTRTGLSPNFLVYGRELHMPRDLFIKDKDRINQMLLNDTDQDYHVKKAAYDLYKKVSHVTRTARDNSQRRAKYMATQYDKRVRGPYYKTGDWCFLLELWPKHKYADTWRGPYKVVKSLNDHNYVVEVEGKEKVVSISKMKPYRINKHSEIAYNPDKTVISEKKQPVKQKSRQNDSSSDEGSVILTWEAPPRRKSRRIAEKRQKFEKTSLNPSSGATTAIGSEATTATEIDLSENTVSDKSIALSSADLETSGMSEQEFVDAQEALDEAQTDRQVEDTDRQVDRQVEDTAGEVQPSTSAGSLDAGKSDNPGPSRSGLHFSGIDTPISLKDITDQERFRRGNRSSSNPTSGTTRSGLFYKSSAAKMTSGGAKASKDGDKSNNSTAPDSVSSDRSKTGYNLRPRTNVGSTASGTKDSSSKEKKVKSKK